MLNIEQQNLEYTTFVSTLLKIGITPTEFIDENKLFNAPAGMSSDTGNAFPGGLVMHCNLVLGIAKMLAKNIRGTFSIDETSLTKVCLLHQIAKVDMFVENDDSWGLKRGFKYKFAETEGVLKVGERSLCMCSNAGIKFTPIEYEAMRVLDKDGDELKSQKHLINIMSLVVSHANELAYAIEKERIKNGYYDK